MIDHSVALADYDRLAAIAVYDLDHPELRRRMDELSVRSARALGQPIGMVSVVLDSAMMVLGASGAPGLLESGGGIPVEWSFCATAVVERAPYVVPDAANDPVQHDNPLLLLAGGDACYAGVPVTTPQGHVVGAHCVIGLAPTEFTEADLAVLRAGAAEASALLEEYRRG
ncbi:GAF domain-containing protein [Kineococcus xinjiangensis]|uniref:GAF domain-containing protein n=1 Tax=Kineococcus xinjiangensis TaxID=512762 RepID=A0A2S6II39_9ACTN|nr:GAF domain-containing protein [Kineococcus xinjiangensis]PPK93883.1 GAF domain-containing protein [Kineococcus xinjiangensis]